MQDQDKVIHFPRSGREHSVGGASPHERLARVLESAIPVEGAPDTLLPVQMVTGNGNIQISYGGACQQVILGNWNIQINQTVQNVESPD